MERCTINHSFPRRAPRKNETEVLVFGERVRSTTGRGLGLPVVGVGGKLSGANDVEFNAARRVGLMEDELNLGLAPGREIGQSDFLLFQSDTVSAVIDGADAITAKGVVWDGAPSFYLDAEGI